MHVLLSRLLVQRHIARSITLIACRSIQIQEACCPLQIKTMGEVADSLALAKWSGDVRLISQIFILCFSPSIVSISLRPNKVLISFLFVFFFKILIIYLFITMSILLCTLLPTTVNQRNSVNTLTVNPWKQELLIYK